MHILNEIQKIVANLQKKGVIFLEAIPFRTSYKDSKTYI